MNLKNNLGIKDIIYLFIISFLLVILFLTHKDDNINILTSSDWVNLVVGSISASATIILGIVAWQQNKKANDTNNRLLNIEEFDRKTFMILENDLVPVKKDNDNFWETQDDEIPVKNIIALDTFNIIEDIDDIYKIYTKCFFKGKIPTNKIIINNYKIQYFDDKKKKKINIVENNEKVITNIQCCNENDVYALYIRLKLNDVYLNKIKDGNGVIVIELNITIKNIMNVSNDYIIKLSLCNVNNHFSNDYYFMYSTIIKN